MSDIVNERWSVAGHGVRTGDDALVCATAHWGETEKQILNHIVAVHNEWLDRHTKAAPLPETVRTLEPLTQEYLDRWGVELAEPAPRLPRMGDLVCSISIYSKVLIDNEPFVWTGQSACNLVRWILRKREPRYRPFTLDEIPLGRVVVRKDGHHRMMLGLAGLAACEGFTYEELLANYVFEDDRSPCGVKV